MNHSKLLYLGNFSQSGNVLTIKNLLQNNANIDWIYIPKDALNPKQNRNFCLIKLNSKQELDKVYQQLQQQFANTPSALINIVDNPYSPKQEKLIQKIYQQQSLQ